MTTRSEFYWNSTRTRAWLRGVEIRVNGANWAAYVLFTNSRGSHVVEQGPMNHDWSVLEASIHGKLRGILPHITEDQSYWQPCDQLPREVHAIGHKPARLAATEAALREARLRVQVTVTGYLCWPPFNTIAVPPYTPSVELTFPTGQYTKYEIHR